MRHTRNRYLKKIGAFIEGSNCLSIDEMRDPKGFWSGYYKLDPTFKWHREYNNVSFDVIHYYPHKVTVPLYVDLYNNDSVYY